jgi:3-methyl-2-oxobutanoate hydroxymethyltransferase
MTEITQTRLTAPAIKLRKGQQPLVMVAVAHAGFAKIADPHADILLVGDSLGMTIYGMRDTLGVTLGMMSAHGRAVVRSSQRSLVVIDLPFASYEESPTQAFRSSAQLLSETGAGAVKLEGGTRMAETVHFLTQRGIPVMGHIGLTPQAVHGFGGFRSQGHEVVAEAALQHDALALQEAGAFAIVIEAVAEPVAAMISKSIAIPTIGIGATASCDGQVLVIEDLLGLTLNPPRFVKAYANLHTQIDEAIATYAAETRSRTFPTAAHIYPRRQS